MISGNYTYVVPSAACPNPQTIVPVNVINSPNVGTPNPQSICINNYGIGNLYDLSNLLVGNPDPGTWYEGGVPVPTNINPNTYGIGTTTFTYQVNGIPPCNNETIDVNLTINPEPVVASFTSSAPTALKVIVLELTLICKKLEQAPFTIDILDDDSPKQWKYFYAKVELLVQQQCTQM